VPELTDDDEAEAPKTRHEAAAFVIIGLLGIPLMALSVGALVLPPGVAFSLIRRGLVEGRTSWVALGGLVGALWLVLLVAAARKLLHRGASAARSS